MSSRLFNTTSRLISVFLQQMKPSPSKADQESVDNFRFEAQEFCKFLDNCTHFDQSNLVHRISELVARLCLAGIRLPEIQPATDDSAEFAAGSVKESSEECVRLATRLRKQLGSLDEYSEVFDPTEDQEAVRCSLSIDLAEMYMDLKEALEQETGLAADVYWQWRFDFVSHWSRHAASALRVLLILSSRV